jgi:hypothetical protein
LITAYQFTDDVNVGGMEYSEYSSIEFLTLNTPFDTKITEVLGIQSQTYTQTPINLNGDTFDIPPGTTLSPDEICYFEMLNNEVLQQEGNTSNTEDANEMLYMKMLEAEINGKDETDEIDIPIEQMGDFSGNNDVEDIEMDDYVDF